MRFLPRMLSSTLLLPTLSASAGAQQPFAMNVAAPPLRGIDAWINSKPLSVQQLRGMVVALHFWTVG